MPETQEESTTGLGLDDVPNGHDEATPAPEEASQVAAAEAQSEMTSSLGLDDVSDEEQEAKPDPQLYLVVAPTGGIARVEQMATMDDVRTELIALEGEDVQVFIFSGERFYVTKGPYR